MVTLQSLEITRVFSTRDGIFACAKYPEWSCEYRFIVHPDGNVRGKTSRGFWNLLSSEGAGIIKAKIQRILIRQDVPFYAA